MGIYLSRPLTTKDCDVQESEKIAACSTDMQGWRVYMEDSHIMYLDNSKDTNQLAIFGVFDGHGGPAVARWVSMNFIQVFQEFVKINEDRIESGNFDYRVTPKSLPCPHVAAIAQTLESSFLNIDELLCKRDPNFERQLRVIQATAMRIRSREMAEQGIAEPNSHSFLSDIMDGKRWKVTEEDDIKKHENSGDADLKFSDIFQLEMEKDMAEGTADETHLEEFNIVHDVQRNDTTEKRMPYDPQSCGCTAVVATIITTPDPVLVVANAGDSRCVLSRDGEAIPMTIDHKPLQEREMNRIKNAGGLVTNGRVDGNLNLSRSLGDLHYKNNTELTASEQKITAKPDLTYITLCDADDFVILACDGIWDILTEQACVDLVHTNWDEYQLENKSLDKKLSDAEICKRLASDLCDHCLAPTPFDPDSAGAGCDNMTAMVIRIKDEWRSSFHSRKKATGKAPACDAPTLYGSEDELANYQLIEVTKFR
eukprot:GHVH01011012.1.p1 GENE.GHVH01011012.1~~GHVH01011012.1.p1  ORF type:complete len:482 (+),score=73.57 GHVH01011012.1:170-1615(+)